MPSQSHIRIKCSECGKTLKVPKTSIGKNGKCPGCKSQIKIEAAQTPIHQESEIRILDSDVVDSAADKNHVSNKPKHPEKAVVALAIQHSDEESVVSFPEIKTDHNESSQEMESNENGNQPIKYNLEVDPEKLPQKMPRNLDGVQEIDVALSQNDICNCSKKFVEKMLLEGQITRFHYARLVKPKPKPDPDVNEETRKKRLESWYSDVEWKPIGEGLVKQYRSVGKLYYFETCLMMYIAIPLFLLFFTVSSISAFQVIGWTDPGEYVKNKDISPDENTSDASKGFFGKVILMLLIPVMANWLFMLVLLFCFVLSITAGLFAGDYLSERTKKYSIKFHKLISDKKTPPPDGYRANSPSQTTV